MLLNSWGEVVQCSVCPANRHDTLFHPVIESYGDKMIVLADSGFHEAKGDPANLKLCPRGHWNERMLIETAFSLLEGVLGLKKIDRRVCHMVTATFAYVAAAYNICINWTRQVKLSLVDFAL